MRILHVVGARPNFIKVAPLMDAFSHSPSCTVDQVLVHTGQHYDHTMSESFLRDLLMPIPDVNLGVGSGSHAAQTAEVMKRFEPVLIEHRPDLVIVVGDVNSTLAAALTAAKLNCPVGHVEAGLRSRDRTMPEEINRIVTDQLSELLFTPSKDADENLFAEGIPLQRIHRVGNVMIDTLYKNIRTIRAMRIPQRYQVEPRGYYLVTLHRPSNVDNPIQYREICTALGMLARQHPVLFPMHPRTLQNARAFGLMGQLKNVRVLEPLSYPEMIGLMETARAVLTDSGGVQEETTALGVPCLTLRSSTERPITILQGTNVLATDRSALGILDSLPVALRKRGTIPDRWDGRAAERIVRVVTEWFSER